jgi:hypothetical protein
VFRTARRPVRRGPSGRRSSTSGTFFIDRAACVSLRVAELTLRPRCAPGRCPLGIRSPAVRWCVRRGVHVGAFDSTSFITVSWRKACLSMSISWQHCSRPGRWPTPRSAAAGALPASSAPADRTAIVPAARVRAAANASAARTASASADPIAIAPSAPVPAARGTAAAVRGRSATVVPSARARTALARSAPVTARAVPIVIANRSASARAAPAARRSATRRRIE